jgi:hypothetical protein
LRRSIGEAALHIGTPELTHFFVPGARKNVASLMPLAG